MNSTGNCRRLRPTFRGVLAVIQPHAQHRGWSYRRQELADNCRFARVAKRAEQLALDARCGPIGMLGRVAWMSGTVEISHNAHGGLSTQ